MTTSETAAAPSSTEPPVAGRVPEPTQWILPPWPWTLRILAVAALFGAEILHVAGIREAYAQWWGAGAAVATLAVAEGLIATWLAIAPTRASYWAAIISGLPTLAVAVTAGAVGLPVGPTPWTAAPPQRAEVTAVCLIILSVTALIPMTDSARLRESARRGRGAAGSLVAAAVIATGASVLVWSALSPPSAPNTAQEPIVINHAH